MTKKEALGFIAHIRDEALKQNNFDWAVVLSNVHAFIYENVKDSEDEDSDEVALQKIADAAYEDNLNDK